MKQRENLATAKKIFKFYMDNGGRLFWPKVKSWKDLNTVNQENFKIVAQWHFKEMEKAK